MKEIIDKTIKFVQNTLSGAETGHDWFHVERVYKSALHINKSELGDELIVALAALLHDIADSKFNNGDEEIGPSKAAKFLNTLGIDSVVIEQVVLIIQNMSFKNSFGKQIFNSKELQIVQDADRLDAMGAIGIARTFNYGGFKNRELYNPKVAPELNHSKESYKNSTSPTINHFYEKLLLLKDLMNTDTGQNLAIERHKFMEQYLEQFYAEWEGKK